MRNDDKKNTSGKELRDYYRVYRSSVEASGQSTSNQSAMFQVQKSDNRDPGDEHQETKQSLAHDDPNHAHDDVHRPVPFLQSKL